MKALLRDTVNQGIERLSEHEMNNLIDILDADGSGSIEVEELLNAIKPRGSECHRLSIPPAVINNKVDVSRTFTITTI